MNMEHEHGTWKQIVPLQDCQTQSTQAASIQLLEQRALVSLAKVAPPPPRTFLLFTSASPAVS